VSSSSGDYHDHQEQEPQFLPSGHAPGAALCDPAPKLDSLSLDDLGWSMQQRMVSELEKGDFHGLEKPGKLPGRGSFEAGC
jgi:hypothetical protein